MIFTLEDLLILSKKKKIGNIFQYLYEQRSNNNLLWFDLVWFGLVWLPSVLIIIGYLKPNRFSTCIKYVYTICKRILQITS